MNKEVMLSLHTGGSFIVTFNDEKDYEIFKKERSKYIGMIIAIFVTFAFSVLSFILMFDYSIFIYFFIGLILLFVLNTKIFYEIENRFNPCIIFVPCRLGPEKPDESNKELLKEIFEIPL